MNAKPTKREAAIATAAASERREEAALARIEVAEDPAALRTIMGNAARLGVERVRDAAFRRLVAVSAEGEPGTVDHDFWSAIHALEAALSVERGKTTRLSRTRQKLARVGAAQTVADLAAAPEPSDGFAMLVERGMWDLSAEAVVIRREADFSPEVVAAARDRLSGAGCDLSSLASGSGA